jgi:hypothetical protein
MSSPISIAVNRLRTPVGVAFTMLPPHAGKS